MTRRAALGYRWDCFSFVSPVLEAAVVGIVYEYRKDCVTDMRSANDLPLSCSVPFWSQQSCNRNASRRVRSTRAAQRT